MASEGEAPKSEEWGLMSVSPLLRTTQIPLRRHLHPRVVLLDGPDSTNVDSPLLLQQTAAATINYHIMRVMLELSEPSAETPCNQKDYPEGSSSGALQWVLPPDPLPSLASASSPSANAIPC